jgi:hypothetical protein
MVGMMVGQTSDEREGYSLGRGGRQRRCTVSGCWWAQQTQAQLVRAPSAVTYLSHSSQWMLVGSANPSPASARSKSYKWYYIFLKNKLK